MPELIWEGKYNDNGQIVDAPRVSLPFQTVETVNQSAQERQMALTAAGAGSNPEWRNRLNLGRQEIRAALPAGRVRRESQSYLH